MLINIKGSLIDTSKIYQVGEVYVKENSWTHGECIPNEYSFNIHFMGNNESTVVSVNQTDLVCPPEVDYSTCVLTTHKHLWEGRHYASLIKECLEKVRNKLIEYWNTSKSAIPEIKFE